MNTTILQKTAAQERCFIQLVFWQTCLMLRMSACYLVFSGFLRKVPCEFLVGSVNDSSGLNPARMSCGTKLNVLWRKNRPCLCRPMVMNNRCATQKAMRSTKCNPIVLLSENLFRFRIFFHSNLGMAIAFQDTVGFISLLDCFKSGQVWIASHSFWCCFLLLVLLLSLSRGWPTCSNGGLGATKFKFNVRNVDSNLKVKAVSEAEPVASKGGTKVQSDSRLDSLARSSRVASD